MKCRIIPLHFNLLRFAFVVALITAATLVVPSALSQSPRPKPHCSHVGGSLMTNFLTQETTLGTATGDLAGAVSAKILNITPGQGGSTTFLVQHNWVTEAGDTLLFEPAEAVALPTVLPNVFGVTYAEQKIVGGTGKYSGVRGTLRSIGAADLQRGQTVFRYEGELCFKGPAKP